MNKNSETIRKVYEAFGKGDISMILDCLAEDVEWELWNDNTAQKAGVPWLEYRKGKHGVADFFDNLSDIKMNEFNVHSILSSEDKVAAEISVDMEVPSLGTKFRDEEFHLWTFDKAGKIICLRHYVDTAKHINAAGKGK